MSRLRALVFASKDLDDAQHAELACVVAEAAKNSGAFEALSALVDHGQSVFVGSAPSVVAQAVAPSLVVRREVRTLEVLFASRRQFLRRACRAVVCGIVKIRARRGRGNRLLSDVASLSASPQAKLSRRHQPIEPRKIAEGPRRRRVVLLRGTGRRSAAARDALDVIGHAVFGARASGVTRRKRAVVWTRLCLRSSGDAVHLVHAVVVHRSERGKADRTEWPRA